MKGIEAQQKSYDKQKILFEEARKRRISNRKRQIEEISKKISALEETRATLEIQNREEREFETFDSFRLKAEEQSLLQKKTKEES